MDESTGVEGPNVGEETAAAKYLPRPETQRQGVALCLSGGGFRAAIFHMGALRRLNETGILSKVDTIASVSGGSIISAHLAERVRVWPEPGAVLAHWEEAVAAPFRRFVARDLCTGPILKKGLPWNWFRTGAQTEALRRRYSERLTPLKLADLPDRPEYVFCATDLVFAANWEFSRQRVGDWLAGYAKQPDDVTVATAVAASSCFPPLFEPMGLPVSTDRIKGGRFRPEEKHQKLLGGVRLSDGGVYDNMGLEPVWKDSSVVLVSDGGAPFQFVESKLPWRLLKRYVDIASRQGSTVRKRWLIAQFLERVMDGTYWGVNSSPQRFDPSYPGYSKELAEEYIARIRTDMNRFTDAEIAILENHGYLLADAAVRRHMPDLVSVDVAPTVPHPEWMDEERVKIALKNSRKQLTLRRFGDIFRK